MNIGNTFIRIFIFYSLASTALAGKDLLYPACLILEVKYLWPCTATGLRIQSDRASRTETRGVMLPITASYQISKAAVI